MPVDTDGAGVLGVPGDAYAASVTPYRLALRRLRHNYKAIVFGSLFIVVVVLCLLAPVYARYIAHTGPNVEHITEVLHINGKSVDVVSLTGVPVGPTWHSRFFLGADSDGRDLAVRLLYGGRTSLAIGAMATAITIVLATALGLVAGYYGRWTDGVISRLFDIVWAYPALLLAIALGVSLATGRDQYRAHPDKQRLHPDPDAGDRDCVCAVCCSSDPRRGARMREREFVESARALGFSNLRIMASEILPNLTSTLIVFVPLQLAHSIILESALSFLGAGVQPPAASWGTLLASGAPLFNVAPYLTLAPATLLVMTCLGINVFGDGLREALDPRARVRVGY